MGGLATEQAVEILVPEWRVNERIDAMAAECLERYAGEQVLYVCLLMGGNHFTSKLMASMVQQDPSYHPQVEYLRCSTYGANRQPGEKSKFDPGAIEAIRSRGQKPVILDDVLDTGETIHRLQRELGGGEALADVDLVALVDKDVPRTHWPEATVTGFYLPKRWLVGMGMDDKATAEDAYRWRGYIAALD